MGYESKDRRPIQSRQLAWVQATSNWLVQRGVPANAISLSSISFSLAAAAAIVAAPRLEEPTTRVLWLAAALFVQLRLLANLLDGMVAIESGEASPIGELFNEVPDRVSDSVIFVAIGLSSTGGSVHLGSIHLGYAAAILAVFVAYLRAVGHGAGVGQVFDGWMAKPQRMATVTTLCLFLALAPRSWTESVPGLQLSWQSLALLVICLGCLATAWIRLRRIAARLRSPA